MKDIHQYLIFSYPRYHSLTWAATLASGHSGKSGSHFEDGSQSAPRAKEPAFATRTEPRTVPLAQASGAPLILHAGSGVGIETKLCAPAAVKTHAAILIMLAED